MKGLKTGIDHDSKRNEHIVFNLDKKRIQTCAPLTVDELKAINQQCKELDWIEENAR